MKESLQKRCELFLENQEKLRRMFRWESSYMHPLCAAILSARDVKADTEKLEECRLLLKRHTGVFSIFRGTATLPVITMLSLSENPEERLEKTKTLYELLKKHFFTSEYLPIVAVMIAEQADLEEYESLAEKTRSIYDLMKQEHPFLTSSEDSPYAAMMALSGRNEKELIEETERCYQGLKEEFSSGNALQALSHVLALGEGETSEKCRRVLELYQCLKEEGHRYGKGYELATLGVLAPLHGEIPGFAQEIAEIDDFLKYQKGFGIFGVGAKQRLMYAGMLAMSDHVNSALSGMETAAQLSTLSLVIAEQAAFCAAICAAIAVSTAAASSNT